MNFIITKRCNKGCPYCFAHQSRVEDPKGEMTLDQFNKLIDDYQCEHIKLLGGEPTCHPQFKDILESVLQKGKSVTLISNFLFGEDIKDFLVNKLIQGYDIHFLVNSTDLDINNRIKVWNDNYSSIYNTLYSIDKEESISCGITIYEKNSAEYYIQYLNFLYSNTPNIERLRISLNFPGDEINKDVYSVINNKSLGNIILCIFEWCLEHYIVPSPDCILFPCLFNNKEEFKFIKKYSNKELRFKCGYNGAPADLFSDGTVSFCYPLKDIINLDIKNYKSSKEIYNALQTEYQIAKSRVCLPEDCKKCEFKKCGMCEGPCLAFYHLKDLDIPKWV